MDFEIIRPKQYQDKIRNYHLFVDGKKVSEIKPASSQIISIPDHSTYIQVKIDWCSSPKFDVSSAKSNKLVIKNSMGGSLLKSLILPLYYITFGKNKYLTIENPI